MNEFIELNGMDIPSLTTDFEYLNDCMGTIAWNSLSGGFAHYSHIINYTRSNIGIIGVNNVLVVLGPETFPSMFNGEVTDQSIMIRTTNGPVEDYAFSSIYSLTPEQKGLKRGVVIIDKHQIQKDKLFYIDTEAILVVIKPIDKTGKTLPIGTYGPEETTYRNPVSPEILLERFESCAPKWEYQSKFQIFNDVHAGDTGWFVSPCGHGRALVQLSDRTDEYPNGYFTLTKRSFNEPEEVILRGIPKDGRITIGDTVYTVGFGVNALKKAIAVEKERIRTIAAYPELEEALQTKLKSAELDITKLKHQVTELSMIKDKYDSIRKIEHEESKIEHEARGYKSTEKQWEAKETIAEHSTSTAKWSANKAMVTAIAAAAAVIGGLIVKFWK